MISYLSPIAQSLLNRKPGEEVEFELDGARRNYRIDSIELFTPVTAPAATPDPSLPASTASEGRLQQICDARREEVRHTGRS